MVPGGAQDGAPYRHAAGASPRPTGCGNLRDGRPHGAAPTKDLKPVPSSAPVCALGHLPPEGKVWRAHNVRPYGVSSTGDVCSAKPGAGVKLHQRQFLQTQGPVAREELRKATPFLRAGNIVILFRRAPRKRGGRGPTPLVKGRWPKARGDREGEYGRISAHSEPSPVDSLVTFSSLRKSLAAGAAKSSPHSLKGNEKRRRGQAPALPRICALTCPLIRPLRGHLPPGGRLSIFVRLSPYNKTHSLTTKERRNHYGKQSHRPHQRGDPA